MYINFNLHNLELGDIELLIAIKQKEQQFLINNLTETKYKRFKELSLVKHIKQANKKEHPYKSLRLDKKGEDLLKNIQEAPVEEEDEKVLEWLIDLYKKAGKEIGNRRKTARHIRDFRIKSGIEKNNLIRLCLDFMKDSENMERSRTLQYLWYHPKTVFDTKFDLEESWLYRHYLKNQERIDKTFEKYE